MSIEKKYCEKNHFQESKQKLFLFGHLEMMNKI